MNVEEFLRGEVFTLDNLFHFLGGAALAAPLWYWHPSAWVVAGVWAIWGLLREQGQSKDEGWLRPFTRIHKWIEGISWGVGGGTLMGIANLIG